MHINLAAAKEFNNEIMPINRLRQGRPQIQFAHFVGLGMGTWALHEGQETLMGEISPHIAAAWHFS